MTTSPLPPLPSDAPPPGGDARERDPAGGAGRRRLRAEDPEDLLAVLPYLLGYHPAESLVMAVVHGKTIGLCMRVDLTEPPAAVAEHFRAVAEAQRADGVLLVAWSADPAVADRMLEPVLAALQPVGVIEALYADGRRRWSRICTDPDCCPPEGVPYDPRGNRLAVEAVYEGLTAYAGRDDIARLVQGPPDERMDELGALLDRTIGRVFAQPLAERRRRIRAWVARRVGRRLTGDRTPLGDEELVRAACLVADPTVRDDAWVLMRSESAWAHVELWQQVVSRTVPPLEAAPLALLGMAAWIAGQGTLQVCCLERGLDVDPDYSMFALLADLNEHAVPPGFWEEARGQLVEALDAVDVRDDLGGG